MSISGSDMSINGADKHFTIDCFLEIIDAAVTHFRPNIEMPVTHGAVDYSVDRLSVMGGGQIVLKALKIRA
jgi:hypothetical protein